MASTALPQLLHLVGLQLLGRITSFALNLFVLRTVEQRAFGVAAVRLYLVHAAVLLLAREAARRLAAREQSAAAVLWLTRTVGFPVGCIAAGVSGAVYSWNARSAAEAAAVWIVCLAAVVELVGEPGHNLVLLKRRIKEKARVEGIAVVLRATFLFLAVAGGWASGDRAVVAFALAQAVQGISVAVGYRLLERREMLKEEIGTRRVSAALAASLWVQSVEKLVLTEGEKYVLDGALGDMEESGAYGLVFNLGSLVVRIVFQPVEEIAGLVFGEQHHKHDQLMRQFVDIMRLVTMLGLLAVAFGPANAFLAIEILYSRRWSSSAAVSVLRIYCVYLLLLAINGVSEAFVFARISPKELRRYNFLLVGFSGLFLGCAIAAVRHPPLSSAAASLVLANCINMSCRILYSFSFISSYFKRGILPMFLEIFPRKSSMAALTLSLVVTSFSAWYLDLGPNSPANLLRYSLQISVSALCLVGSLWTVMRTDKELLELTTRIFRRSRAGAASVKKTL